MRMGVVMRAVVSVLIFLTLITLSAVAQWREPPMTGSAQELLPDRTNIEGMSGMGPEITAGLVDREQNAKQHRAVVKVSSWGTAIANSGQMHGNLDANTIVYQLDDQNPVADGSEMVFENLAPGKHTVTVMMADSEGHQEGDKSELKFEIPK
jgi:hypothetical protein